MKYSVSLKSNRDFRRLYSRGKQAVAPTMVLYTRKNRLKENRLGITTGKKLGKAVQRSRCRRVIRAAFAPLYPAVGGYDIVFVARGRLLGMKSTELQPVMERQLRQLGVLRDE